MSELLNSSSDAAPLDVGLVGVGAWGKRVLASAVAVPNLCVRWVCDPTLTQAPNATTQLVASVDELLLEPACKALLVATPEDTHGGLALLALNAGKFVFVEKPLCTRDTDLTALLRHMLAPTHLMVGHLLAYDFAFSALAKIHACRAFSTIHSVRHSLPGARPERSAWWALAPHDISVLLRVWGVPKRVQVSSAETTGGVAAVLEFSEGRTAHLSLSTNAACKRRSFVASAESYQLSIDDARESRVSVRQDQEQRSIRLPGKPPLERELRHFANRVRRGGEFLTGVMSGARVVDVLLAGQQSLETGEPCYPRARLPGPNEAAN